MSPKAPNDNKMDITNVNTHEFTLLDSPLL